MVCMSSSDSQKDRTVPKSVIIAHSTGHQETEAKWHIQEKQGEQPNMMVVI